LIWFEGWFIWAEGMVAVCLRGLVWVFSLFGVVGCMLV
jgi:hypothetical protein